MTACSDKKIVTALVAGITAFLALSSAVPVIAEDLPDISEKVEEQEVFTETNDLNTIILNSIDAPNKIFVGWNTEPDGSGKLYKAGDRFDITQNQTIYPVWEDVVLTISHGDNSVKVNSGENAAFEKSTVKVGDEGICVAPDEMNFTVTVNDGCVVDAEYIGIDVTKEVEASEDELTIYPIFENKNDQVGIRPEYELKIIKDGKIIGKVNVAVPMILKPAKNYGKDGTEVQRVLLTHEDGSSEYVNIDDLNLGENGEIEE